tara:strand:+ start:338 stop:730 length:393 start_codon:yes stop_codon:yes gene_type:complete
MWLIIVAIVILGLFYLSRRGIPHDKVRSLVQRSAAFAVQAQQDTAPVQSIVHATYANAYLDALKNMSSEREIQQASGVNLKVFEEHINNVQSSVTQKVLEKVPDLAGTVDLYLHSISTPGVDWAKSARGM